MLPILSTGEIIASAGDEVSAELADEIQNAAVPYVWIQTEERERQSSFQYDGRSDKLMWTAIQKSLVLQSWYIIPVLQQILQEYSDKPEELADAISKECIRTDSKTYYKGRYFSFH